MFRMRFSQAFQERLGTSKPELDAELARAWERVTQAWPSVRVDEAVFGREVAARVPAGRDPVEALPAMRLEDLYLAVACAAGNAAALAAFEERYGAEVRATLARMGLSAVADETAQVMREELFVGPPPRIETYAGRGDLRRWVRAVAGRTGLRVARQAGGGVELRESVTAAAQDDLEIDFLKRTYGPAFREAFREALEAMPAKDRLLLKQRFRHHLTIEELGGIYGTHASTVSRWVTDARGRLVGATRDAMMRRLHVGRAEVSSILRLIESELEISLSLAPGAA